MGAWSLSHWSTWELPPTLVFEKINPLPNISSSPSTSTNLLRSLNAHTSSSAFLEALSFTVAIVQTHLCVGKYASPQWPPTRVKFCASLLPSNVSLLKHSLYHHSDAGSDTTGRRKFLPLQDAPLEGRQQTFSDPRGPHNLGWKLFWFFCHAGGILVPWPGIEPGPSAVKALCPNRWMATEFLFWLLKEHTVDWVDQGRYLGSGNSFNIPGFRWIQCITPRFISGLDEVFLLPGYIYLWEILPLALPSTQLLFSYPSSSRSDTLQAIFLRHSQLPLETLKNDRGIDSREWSFPQRTAGNQPVLPFWANVFLPWNINIYS